MPTRSSTKSPVQAELAALRLEVAELRATLLPLSVPALRELALLQQQLAKSARQSLPGSSDSELLERLDALPQDVVEALTTRVMEFVIPLLPVLLEIHPKLGELLRGVPATGSSST